MQGKRGKADLARLKEELSAATSAGPPKCKTCTEAPVEALELIDYWIDERKAGRMSASMAGRSKDSLYSILVREFGYAPADNTMGRHVRSVQAGGRCQNWRKIRGVES